VAKINANNYLSAYNLSNIGGILGLQYNIVNQNQVWQNLSSGQFSINLQPSSQDYSWIEDAP